MGNRSVKIILDSIEQHIGLRPNAHMNWYHRKGNHNVVYHDDEIRRSLCNIADLNHPTEKELDILEHNVNMLKLELI